MESKNFTSLVLRPVERRQSVARAVIIVVAADIPGQSTTDIFLNRIDLAT